MLVVPFVHLTVLAMCSPLLRFAVVHTPSSVPFVPFLHLSTKKDHHHA